MRYEIRLQAFTNVINQPIDLNEILKVINMLFFARSPSLIPQTQTSLYLRTKQLTMKYNQLTLNKIEKILDESEYVVRYERGTFQSGYCILEDRKIVVLNKFLQTEGRVSILIDLIPQLNVNPGQLSPDTRKAYEEVIQQHEAANNP